MESKEVFGGTFVANILSFADIASILR